MPRAPLHPAGPLAAVDLGSTSFRLEIGDLRHGRYRRIDELKDRVQLGAGLDDAGRLTPEAIERGLVSLRHFAHRLRGFDPARVRAVATQTLREARNRHAFLEHAQAVLGFPIEVISGREEARLIYAGVSQLQPSDDPRLVIDIGGRSTEMILGTGRVPGVAESFQVGCVDLSLRFFPGGVIEAEGFRAARVAAGAKLEEGLPWFSPGSWRQALGASGTVGAISQWLVRAGVSDGTITTEGLRWGIAQCLQAGHVDRLHSDGAEPQRHAVLPGGLAILDTLMALFGIHALQPADGALRHGVIVDLRQRLRRSRSPLRARPGQRVARDRGDGLAP